MADDIKYMRRCLELAALGSGSVAPNPLVGAVIVHDGTIISEGYHKNYGGPHAEVNAVENTVSKELLTRSTLYVSLEPCSHFGKTPPCTDLILRCGIPEVVIGCVDPYAEVSGKGIARLRDAGLKVTAGVLENECRDINRRFFTYHIHKRPYVILKWAQSSDCYISAASPAQRKISNELSHTLVHRWRSEEQAIMVGTNTALSDNPQLNVRLWKGNNPVRCVFDRTLRLPETLHLFDGSVPTVVFTDSRQESKNGTEYVQIDFKENIIPQVLSALYERNIQSLLVEGGSRLLQSFIDSGLWDEARVFTSPVHFGEGTPAPIFKGELKSTDRLEEDTLAIYRPYSS